MIRPAAPSPRVAAVAAGILAVQAIAAAVLVAVAGPALLVIVQFDPPSIPGSSFGLVWGGSVTFFADVGIIAVPLVASVAMAAAALAARRGPRASALASTAHWIGVSQALGITVVIIALINGAGAASTIVPLYALAAGSALLGWLSDRAPRHDGTRAHLWPYAALTVFAIVPWGVVALVQITGLLLDAAASDAVRTVTLVVLVATVLWAVVEWAITRPAGPARRPTTAATLRVWAATALASIPSGAIATMALIGS